MDRMIDTLGRVLLESSLRGGLLLALAGFAAWTLRRRSAALRHAVWLAALGAMLAMPMLALLPRWSLPVLPPSPATVAGTASLVVTAESAELLDVSIDGSTAAVERASRARPIASLLLLVWMAGVTVVAARELESQRRLARLLGASRPVGDPRIAAVWSRRQDASGVELRLSPHAQVPLACGIVRPIVLLPDDASTWGPGCLRTVLSHELAHVRRRDPLWTLVARVACTAFWFHPLVWLAGRRLKDECERACDDAVVRGGERPSRYAETLLFVATRVGYDAPGIALPLARRGGLERRISEILARRRDLSALGRRLAWGLGILTVGVATIVSIARPVSGSAATPRPDGSTDLYDWLTRAASVSPTAARTTQATNAPVRILAATVRVVPNVSTSGDAGITAPEVELANDGARRVTAIELALDLPGNHDRTWCDVAVPARGKAQLRVASGQWSAIVARSAASRLTVHVSGVRFDQGEAWSSGEPEPSPEPRPKSSYGPKSAAPKPTSSPTPHADVTPAPSQPAPLAETSPPSRGQMVSREFPDVPSVPARFRNPDGAQVVIIEARTPTARLESPSGHAMTAVPAVRIENRSQHRVVAVKLRYKGDPETHAVTICAVSLEPGAAAVVSKTDFATWGRAEDMTVQLVGARFDDGSVWGVMDSTIDTRDAWVYPLEGK